MRGKQRRIIRLTPSKAIVNVKHKENDYAYVGYVDDFTVQRDLDRLREAYPGVLFDIIPYIELEC